MKDMNAHMQKVMKGDKFEKATAADLTAFYLDPEDDTGNHEYKYKLTGLSKDELEE